MPDEPPAPEAEDPPETPDAPESTRDDEAPQTVRKRKMSRKAKKRSFGNRMYLAVRNLGKAAWNLLLLPIDLLRLTWQAVRGLRTIFKGITSGKSTFCPYCYSVNSKGLFPRPVYATKRFANWWVMKLLCPCMKGPDKRLGSPYCERKDPRKWVSVTVLPILLLMLLGWALVGYGSYRYSDNVVRLFKGEEKFVKPKPKKRKPVDPDKLEAVLAKGRALYDEGKYKEARIEFLNAAKMSPTNAVCHLELGRSLLKEEKYREALAHYLQAEKLDPEYHEAQVHIGDLYFAARRYDKVIEFMEKAKDHLAGDIPRQLTLAQAYMVKRRPDEAKQMIASVIKHWHDNKPEFSNLLWVGRLLAGMGEQKAAVRLFRTTVERHPDHFESHIGLVAMLISQRQIPEAEEALKRAEALGPDKPELEIQKIELVLARDGAEAGIPLYQDFVARHPNHFVVKARLANLHLGMGKEDEAKLIADEMTDAPSKDQRVQGNLIRARIYFEKRLYSDAIVAVRRALLEDENHPAALLLLAQSLFMQQKYQMAIVELKRVQDLAPDLVLASLLLARAQHELGQVEQSRETYRRTAERFPNSSTALLELANFFYLEKNYDEAASYYEKLLETNPNSAAAKNNLAQVLADQGKDLDRAHALAKELYDQFPNNPVFADLMGWVLYRQGKITEALPLLRAAVRGLPRFAAVHYHFGAALLANGERESAKLELETALKLTELFAGADHAREMLIELGGEVPETK